VAVKKVFSQKKFNWAYEREWRVLGRIGRVSMSTKRTIRRIYMGSRISDEHSMERRSALRGTRIIVYQMTDSLWLPIHVREVQTDTLILDYKARRVGA